MKKHAIALTIGLIVLQQAAHASNNTTFDDVSDAVMKITAPAAVPVPAAAWLMGSGLVGLTGIARRRRMHD